jgi:LemA protein
VTVVLLLLVGLLAACLTSLHNRLVRQRNLVEESWRQVDVELRRRHDLVPALVSAVSAYAAHEQGALAQLLAARAAAAGTDADAQHLQDRGSAEGVLSGSLRELLAVAEDCPQLRAAQPFARLQEQLAETEDRLAAARRFHNANVRALNNRVESFPSLLVARSFGVDRADTLDLDLEPVERAQLDEAPVLAFEPPDPPRTV